MNALAKMPERKADFFAGETLRAVRRFFEDKDVQKEFAAWQKERRGKELESVACRRPQR